MSCHGARETLAVNKPGNLHHEVSHLTQESLVRPCGPFTAGLMHRENPGHLREHSQVDLKP